MYLCSVVGNILEIQDTVRLPNRGLRRRRRSYRGMNKSKSLNGRERDVETFGAPDRRPYGLPPFDVLISNLFPCFRVRMEIGDWRKRKEVDYASMRSTFARIPLASRFSVLLNRPAFPSSIGENAVCARITGGWQQENTPSYIHIHIQKHAERSAVGSTGKKRLKAHRVSEVRSVFQVEYLSI